MLNRVATIFYFYVELVYLEHSADHVYFVCLSFICLDFQTARSRADAVASKGLCMMSISLRWRMMI